MQHIGLALSADRVTAVVPGTALVVSAECALSAETDVTEKLAVVLEDIRARLAAACATSMSTALVDVALLPPLAEVRLILLPPLQPAEAETVIRRDAARHFVGGNGARTIAVSVPPRSRAHDLPVLAAAAPSALIEQVRDALAAIGWRVHTVTPALTALLAASQRGARSTERMPRVIVAQVGDTLHVLRAARSPLQLRRVPVSSIEEVYEAVGRGPGRACIWTESDARASLMRGLAAAGWQIESDESEGGAAAAAAHFAGRSSLELVPQSLANERQRRQRRKALQFAAIAALFVIAAGAIELWGARRELATIRARRAAIRQEVTPLLAVRDSLNMLEQRLTQIGGLQAAAPHWTSALFDLAMLLPADAYLRSLRASGDTLVIEASGSRAGETIQALRSAPTLRDVQLRGQVERQLEDGSTAVERFTLQARLAGSAASTSTSDSTSAKRPERARPVPGRSR